MILFKLILLIYSEKLFEVKEMFGVFKKIAENMDDFLFGVFGVVVGLIVYDKFVKDFVEKIFKR